MNPEWSRFCVALGLGLLIGLERERSKGEGPGRRPAGIRTFALASLLGAVAFHLGGAWLLAVATAGVAALTAISHRRSQERDPGLTTEIGLVVVPLLGALAMTDPLLAAGLAVAVAVLFAAKVPLHDLVKGALTDAEVRDGLVFAIATLVVWPQLPDRVMGPYAAINPHRIWLVVVLVLTLGALGHAATRILGRRYGLALSGLAAGFVSSTATIGSMAGRAAQDPASLHPAVAGSAFSTVSTFVQMAILLSTVSPPTLLVLAPALATGAIVAAVYAVAFTLRGSEPTSPPESEPGRAFSVVAALGLATLLAVMLIVTAALKQSFGTAGVLAGTAVAGIVDTHAAAVSVASLVASSTLTAQESVVPILAAMSSNALAKIALAIGVGSRAYAVRIVPGIVLSIAAAWAVASFTLSR
ncbi:MAG: MgtC/SapB family protein [Deltaproteobacteria bacterium]|nr:MgtC/SapB family protein [Deltaproteobacteria bacterium]